MKETDTDLRKLWVIYLLLDIKKRTQKEIVQEINDIGSEINLDIGEPLIKTNDQILSPIMKKLDKKLNDNGIITRKEIDVEGKTSKANECWLSSDLKNFVNTIKVITISKVEEPRKNFFIRCLINSKYGELFINDELVPKLLEKYGLPSINLDTNEKQMITGILRLSPIALEYTISSISNKNPEYLEEDSKEKLLSVLLTYLSLDLLDPYSGIMYSVYPHKIKFQSTLSFSSEPAKSNELNYPELEIGIEENCLISKMEHTSYGKKLDRGIILKAYSNTFNILNHVDYE